MALQFCFSNISQRCSSFMQALASCGVLLTYLDNERKFSASHGVGKHCPERPLTEALSDLLSGMIISEFALVFLYLYVALHSYMFVNECLYARGFSSHSSHCYSVFQNCQ
jgi:hypothetical protein